MAVSNSAGSFLFQQCGGSHKCKISSQWTNGLALCRLCHWSFDEGLMSVGRNYEVLVSRQAKKDPNIPGPIMTFADRPIFRPLEDNYWPSQSNFAWHRESVFE